MATVAELYRQILGREPDAAGLAAWTQQFGSEVDQTELNMFAQAAAPELAVSNYHPNISAIDSLVTQAVAASPTTTATGATSIVQDQTSETSSAYTGPQTTLAQIDAQMDAIRQQVADAMYDENRTLVNRLQPVLQALNVERMQVASQVDPATLSPQEQLRLFSDLQVLADPGSGNPQDYQMYLALGGDAALQNLAQFPGVAAAIEAGNDENILNQVWNAAQSGGFTTALPMALAAASGLSWLSGMTGGTAAATTGLTAEQLAAPAMSAAYTAPALAPALTAAEAAAAAEQMGNYINAGGNSMYNIGSGGNVVTQLADGSFTNSLTGVTVSPTGVVTPGNTPYTPGAPTTPPGTPSPHSTGLPVDPGTALPPGTPPPPPPFSWTDPTTWDPGVVSTVVGGTIAGVNDIINPPTAPPTPTATSSTVYSPAEQAIRDFQQAEAQRIYQQNLALETSMGNPAAVVAPQSQDTLNAQNLLRQYATGAGQTGVNEMLSGMTYGLTGAMDVENNPYLQDAITASLRPMTQQFTDAGGALANIRSDTLQSGQYGGTRQGLAEGIAAGRLAQAQGDVTARMGSEAYQKGQDTFARTLALAPSLLQAGQMPAQALSAIGTQNEAFQQEQNAYDAAGREFNLNRGWTPLRNFAEITGATSTPTTVTTGTAQPAPRRNLVGDVLSGAMTANTLWGMMNPQPTTTTAR